MILKYDLTHLNRTRIRVGFGLLILILWAQTGFVMDGIHVFYLIANYGTWMLLLPYLNGWVHTRKVTGWLKGSLQLIILVSGQWMLSNVLFYLLRHFILKEVLIPGMEEVYGSLLPSIVSRLIDMSVLIGVLLWINQNRQLAEQRLEVAEKESNMRRDKLRVLKNQLNPHFLFNTMHGISSLIGHDDDKAQQLTIKTSSLLRQMLAINERERHTLNEEWNFVKDYLDIESERFKDRLKVELQINHEAMDQEVPTMILQPLIENAFKHGISKRVDASVLKVSISVQEGFIMLQVINDLSNDTVNSPSTGVGLRNLEARLLSFYANASLTYSKDEHFHYAVIKLPAA